jgi:hypothetical protein
MVAVVFGGHPTIENLGRISSIVGVSRTRRSSPSWIFHVSRDVSKSLPRGLYSVASRIAEAVKSEMRARDASLRPTVSSPRRPRRAGMPVVEGVGVHWGEVAWRAQPAFFARALSPRVSYATQPLIMNGTTDRPPLWISGGPPYWLGNRVLKSTLHHTGHYSPYFTNNTK